MNKVNIKSKPYMQKYMEIISYSLRASALFFFMLISTVTCVTAHASNFDKFKDYWMHMSEDEKMAFIQGYDRGADVVCIYIMSLRDKFPNYQEENRVCERLFTFKNFEKLKAAIRVLDYTYVKKTYKNSSRNCSSFCNVKR